MVPVARIGFQACEALRYVVMHAEARQAYVRLRRTAETAELSIVDDGKGFDLAVTRRRTEGLGLISLAERARLAGGTVSIVIEVAKGTRVHVQVPANSRLGVCNEP